MLPLLKGAGRAVGCVGRPAPTVGGRAGHRADSDECVAERLLHRPERKLLPGRSPSANARISEASFVSRGMPSARAVRRRAPSTPAREQTPTSPSISTSTPAPRAPPAAASLDGLAEVDVSAGNVQRKNPDAPFSSRGIAAATGSGLLSQKRARERRLRVCGTARAEADVLERRIQAVQWGSPALLAQLVEHFHGKEGVSGSSPEEGSTSLPANPRHSAPPVGSQRSFCRVLSSPSDQSVTNRPRADGRRGPARPRQGARRGGARAS